MQMMYMRVHIYMAESLHSPSESIATLLTGCHTPTEKQKVYKKNCVPPQVLAFVGAGSPARPSLFPFGFSGEGHHPWARRPKMQETSCVRIPRDQRARPSPILPGSRRSHPRAAIPSQMPTHWLWITGQKFTRPQLWRPEVQNQGVQRGSRGCFLPEALQRETVASCSPGGCWQGWASLGV